MFASTPGTAQGLQINGQVTGAEVIGAALVYPEQGTSSLLKKVESCMAKGVTGCERVPRPVRRTSLGLRHRRSGDGDRARHPSLAALGPHRPAARHFRRALLRRTLIALGP